MNLYTSKRLHSYEWEYITIYDDMMEIVETLSRADNAPVMTDRYPEVYRVALILDIGSFLVVTHCTADVRVTSDRPVTS